MLDPNNRLPAPPLRVRHRQDGGTAPLRVGRGQGAAPTRPLVLGAGPAGITAGYLLAKRGQRPLVLEAAGQVGGLARTEVRDGYRFDLGGHRFYTKSAEVKALWRDVLGDELLRRPRLSRIRWRGRFVDYPLRAGDVVRKVGPVEVCRSGTSYLAARARRPDEATTFEQWVTQRFGSRLFELFFRTYTEKVWGVPCAEISAEWAAQRIKGLSLWGAARSSLGVRRSNVRTLIEEFDYPRLGPGQMWERMAAETEADGGEVRLAAPVRRIGLERGRIAGILAAEEWIETRSVISSLPLRAVVGLAEPGPAAEVVEAAAGLRYRDFICVALVVDGADPFPDNWIYIHDPEVRVGRVQNFRAWSPAMVPEAGRSCVGLEYFCFEGDELWSMNDAALIELARAEIDRLGLVAGEDVVRGYAVRVPKAYPIYDAEYEQRVATIRRWLESLDGIQQVGRNGLHRYNNSDHSMLTAIRAVENLYEGAAHDLWAVNADGEYLEEERTPPAQPYRNVPIPPAMAGPLVETAER